MLKSYDIISIWPGAVVLQRLFFPRKCIIQQCFVAAFYSNNCGFCSIENKISTTLFIVSTRQAHEIFLESTCNTSFTSVSQVLLANFARNSHFVWYPEAILLSVSYLSI